MKHSKQLTVLLAMILVLLIFGLVFYLYLSAFRQTVGSIQPDTSDDERVEDSAVVPERSEAEIRARLESVMGTPETEVSAASSSETFERLQAVMGNQAEPEVDPDEVRAKLEAVMNNN